MKLYRTCFLFLTLLPLAVPANEPSAYGAGNLDSAHPYGLTPEEKALLETKKQLQHVEVKTKTQESKVESLRERIDGLQTIIEGLAQKNHKLELQIHDLSKKVANDESSVDEYEKRLEALVTQNSADISSFKEALDELNATLQKEYVSKEELQKIVNDFNTFKKLVAKELKSLAKGSDDSLSKLSKAEILKRAERAYAKKHYTQAITFYKYLLAHNYKPARSSFKLGEIYYYRKDYATALAYYKESAKRYSKASWMPTLMLHTALSMKYTGDKKNAQLFFKALIKKYPSSKAAKIAKKYI